MEYRHYPERPAVLEPEFLASAFRQITDRIEGAEKDTQASGWLEIYRDWNDLRAYVSGERARRYYRLTKDMRDETAEADERFFREELKPIAEKAGSTLTEALVKSRHKDAVAEKYGRHLLQVLEISRQPLNPVNADLRVQEGQLTKEYDKLCASGEVEVSGEKKTLAQAGALTISEDEELRKEAYLAVRGWFLDNREELARIYHELVKTRTQMGKNLEHEDFIPLGYAGMERTDYGPEQTAAFRAAVLEFASPLYGKILAAQAKSLGQENLAPWDTGYHPDLTLPTDIAEPIVEQLERAQRVFDRVAPKLGAHFKRMRNEGLIDLENRKGKASGAYCTTMPDEGRVAIFCNSTGSASDVSTLMHEMGHAFQGWESQWIEATTLRSPTADACEIHSMGMEYLSQPYLDEFFEAPDLARFRKDRWSKAVFLLCYVSVVDEFQHRVYENPDMSPDERDEAWNQIQSKYMPGVDWQGREDLQKSRWYAQLHIFRYPFYYIDYAIAEMGAMQLALLDADDHDKALETYLELCRIGGTKSVLGIFESAHLRSPFDRTLMRDLMEHARSQLAV